MNRPDYWLARFPKVLVDRADLSVPALQRNFLKAKLFVLDHLVAHGQESAGSRSLLKLLIFKPRDGFTVMSKRKEIRKK